MQDEKIKKVIDKIFPEDLPETEEILSKYKPRNISSSAMVTRVAPSPTGFMHIGTLYTALICERLAHQSGGIFYLRIEDTDKKREMDGAVKIIVDALHRYKIIPDEGEVSVGKEVGDYGPYKQSDREKIYKSFVKKLLLSGDAYPAFETAEELSELNKKQTAEKVVPGYYGKWATWREKSLDDAIVELEKGNVPVIRLRSKGDLKKEILVDDMFKGKMSLPQNDQDIVILKSDGLPTYHFAHVIDDHLMGTTHVLRGDEWLSSLTLHLQLFDLFGWNKPIYGHIAPIQKTEGSSRRKLSKRKDPEANVEFYLKEGYPEEAIIMYLLNLANSSFEEWLLNNPRVNLSEYILETKELRKGAGALLDLKKIASFSKDFIGTLSIDETYDRALSWAKGNDAELASVMEKNIDYTKSIFSIDRDGNTARKDIVKWSDLRNEIGFFYDEIFDSLLIDMSQISEVDSTDIKKISDFSIKVFSECKDKDDWLSKMREAGNSIGYAPDMKTFKASPEKYKGNFGTVAKVVRVLLVGRNQSPDLYEVMKVMGRERVERRLSK